MSVNLKNMPPNIPDLRKPSAPKRLLWAETEVANTVVHGFMVQVATSIEGVMVFGSGQPVFRLVRVEEGGEAPALFEDHLQGGVVRVSLETAEEICRTSKMAVAEIWRGDVDLSERVLHAWRRHLDMWRAAHPLVVDFRGDEN